MNIQAIFAKATTAVEFMYDKKATIRRQMAVVKENGADGMEWVPIHEGVPCRLSNPGLNNTNQSEANVIKYDVKLFLSSEFEVKAGDEITIHILKGDQIVSSVDYESSKEPFVYVSHQEVLLVRKEFA
ncbi:hypothetical protein BACCIP111883_01651 [Sutcliffiella rhizosphaerae]|uniref:ABC transporter ATP-binding protein n=1 Tax=Sutcliffiella rhizosphaerae TaxID=2880967 RepID=A0ABN8A760_9BACI|nr:hypothetical protein BACCIP111883_01651 [Sutcliffiella rhizosphaerae]